MTETRTMHLTLSEPAEPDRIKQALSKAGFETDDIRETANNQHGYILTSIRAMGIWNQETGRNRCKRKHPEGCPGKPAHRSWHELTPEQQHIFVNRYVQFIENCRHDELLVAEIIGENEEFDRIALAPGHED